MKRTCQLPAANVLGVHARTPAERTIGSIWTCTVCDEAFNTRQALAAHSFRKHGYIRRSRFYAGRDAVCNACLLQFGCRGRLIEHLSEKSPLCMHNLALSFEPFDEDTVAKLDAEDRETARALRRAGRRRVVAESPCVRLHGPTMQLVDWAGTPLDSEVRHPLGRNRRYSAPA